MFELEFQPVAAHFQESSFELYIHQKHSLIGCRDKTPSISYEPNPILVSHL